MQIYHSIGPRAVFIPQHTSRKRVAPPNGLGSFQDKYLRDGLAKHPVFTLSPGNRRGGPRLMDPLLGHNGELFNWRTHTRALKHTLLPPSLCSRYQDQLKDKRA